MTQQEMEKEIQDLKRKIEELENWVIQRKIQQISFPLDKSSINSITLNGTLEIAKALQNAGYIIT